MIGTCNVSKNNIFISENLGKPMKVYAMCSGSVRKLLAATLLKDANCALIVLEYIEF